MKTTAEQVSKAAKDSKTITEVYHKLGGKGDIDGRTSKQLRTLVPNLNDILNANKVKLAGGPFKDKEAPKGVKTVTLKKPTTPETPDKAVQESIEAGKRAKAIVAAEKSDNINVPARKSSTYREGSKYAILFGIASRMGKAKKDDIISEAVKTIKDWTPECAEFALKVLANENQKSNGHKSKDIATERGYYHIVPVNA